MTFQRRLGARNSDHTSARCKQPLSLTQIDSNFTYFPYRIFSLARDSSWEKGGPSHSNTTNSSGPGPATRGRIPVTPQRQPNLRRIPLHGILAEDRV